jgi:hypothetical protein
MPAQHEKILRPCQSDTIQLAMAVEERFVSLFPLYERITGTTLLIPEFLNADMFRWREMVVRLKKGDYRHTEDEFRSLTRIADWTLQVNAKLRNQPAPQVDWNLP